MNKNIKFTGLSVLALLAISSYWLIQRPEILQYIFFLRYPIIIACLLCFLPSISIYVAPSLLKNLFVLRNNLQLAIVIVNTVLAGMATTIVYNTILANAYLRFAVVPFTPIPKPIEYLLAVILSLPITLKSIALSHSEIKPKSIKNGLCLGVILSIFILVAIAYVRILVNSNNFFKQILLISLSKLPINLQKGYILSSGELASGITEVFAFYLVLLVVYFITYNTLKPRINPRRFEAPALGYIPLILSWIVLLLGGLSFFLDYFRVPVILVFLFISAISYLLGNVDHFYDLQESDNKKPNANEWKQVINQRLAKCPSKNKTLVVVSASGGGIQAAAWTTTVLTGLQKVLDPTVIQSIGWISAVSGGSVGTMYYLDMFGENGYPEADTLEKIVHNASEDSLDAVGWGFAFPDLLKFIGLPFLINKMEDRGTAIEIDWKGELKNKDASLVTWYEQVKQGLIPIPILNATLVEDGRRFLISPMTFCANHDHKYNGNKTKSIDFNTLYPKYNINVTTAARLSASFPYIAPVSRPNQEIKQIFHVADGGYFDNFGVVTSVELLDRFLSSDAGQEIKKVLFLQIQAFPSSQISNENSGDPGWVMEVLGSLKGVFKVRSSTQTAGNLLKVNLLKEKWEQRGIEIANFTIVFPEHFNQKYPQPLSWQLTKEQKLNIQAAWNYLVNYHPHQSNQHNSNPDQVIYDLQQKWQEWHQPNQAE
ncbi:MAG TPA: patatin-like phospholipase family protein [Nostocaceae cyanobacterium]|nr:patatin-like phospholipase family protein [Nostocaceae cyanobacterium]